MGGPSGASRKRVTTNVVACFLRFFLSLPATNDRQPQAVTITTSLASKREPEVVFCRLSTPFPPPPPPSHPNASWRWSFSPFSTACHHHHLPRIQTRAGGGVSCLFRPPATTTTSLASKREPELMFFGHPTRFPPPLPPLPPPSHPNARRMWCLSAFGRNYPCHLPRGCPFRRFRRNAASGEI